jgi:REP element-mobilizing transposase RayT
MAMVTEMRLRGEEEGGERFNYRGLHRYLITLLAAGSESSLTARENVLKILAALRQACAAHQFELYAYCFLPEKLVMLVRGKSEDSDMKKFIADCRSLSSDAVRTARGLPLWARKYQERVLRKTEITRAVAEGVFLLPVSAGLAPSPSAYEFQGSFVLPSVHGAPGPTVASTIGRPAHRVRRNGPPWERKSPGTKPWGQKPSGHRPPGNKPWEQKPSGHRPPGNKPWGQKPPGHRPPGNKPWEQKPTGHRPPGNKPWEQKPSGHRPPGNKPWEQKPSGHRPPGNKPWGEKPSGHRPPGNKPWDQKPSGHRPPGNKPWDQKPSGHRPPGNKPWDQKPPGRTPPGIKPPEKKTWGKKPHGRKPGGFKPSGHKPGGNESPGQKSPG